MSITLDKIVGDCATIRIVDAGGDELEISASGGLTVVATDLDIRDLTDGSGNSGYDQIRIGDGTNTLSVNADGSLNVVTTPDKPDNIKTSSATVTTTNAEVLSTPLTDRCTVTIQNLGTESVFLSHTAGTAKADSVEIPACSSATYEMGAGVDIFLQADSGSQDVRFLEIGA